MMTGSIEYVSNWIEPYHGDDLVYQTLTFIMLILFVLLIPILLVNLLVRLCGNFFIKLGSITVFVGYTYSLLNFWRFGRL